MLEPDPPKEVEEDEREGHWDASPRRSDPRGVRDTAPAAGGYPDGQEHDVQSIVVRSDGRGAGDPDPGQRGCLGARLQYPGDPGRIGERTGRGQRRASDGNGRGGRGT